MPEPNSFTAEQLVTPPACAPWPVGFEPEPPEGTMAASRKAPAPASTRSRE